MTRAKAQRSQRKKNDSELGVLGVLAGANPVFMLYGEPEKFAQAAKTFKIAVQR
jgi:hypothetical protein